MTALQWAYDHGACKEAIRWLKKHKNLTMAQAYAICPNVSWMWWALKECVFAWGCKRRGEIDIAMDAFFVEFNEETGLTTVMMCFQHLSSEQLSYWADRLRQYVVPR